MDALGDLLAPYSAEIAKFAGTVTCLQFLSGIFLLNDIRKRGKSDAYPPEPFLGGVVLTVLSLKLGVIMADQAMIKVNLIGFAINILFMSVFYWYATDEFKTTIWAKTGIAGVIVMLFMAYTSLENPDKLEFRLGMMITGILVFLVGSPLLSLGDIIERQSTEGLPFPLILSGTIVAASWTLYGISIYNTVLTYQNLFLFILSAIQLSLFAIYPSTPEYLELGESPSELKPTKSSMRADTKSVHDLHDKTE